jgi:hypothetical protein
MVAMRLEKLRQVDLNLLVTFAAIAEEKSVTAAESRPSDPVAEWLRTHVARPENPR